MPLFSDNHLRVLKEDLKYTNRVAFAAGTRKNLIIQWESFLLFCMYFKFLCLPASTQTLQIYAQFLSRTFKSVDSIKNYISGIKTMHLLIGYPVEQINGFVLNLSLRGLTRVKMHCVKKAEAITPEILLQISSILNFEDFNDKVFWCLFLFAFFLLARKSNLVPTSQADIFDKKCLLKKDVTDRGEYLIVRFRWTKTIQYGERCLELPLIQIKDSVLCPVQAYHSMCKEEEISKDSPLFVLSNKKAVTYAQFQNKLRLCIRKIGLDPNCFSTHGFRRGGTTLAFRAHISSDKIKLMGDWKSDCYRQYLAFDLKDKLSIAKELRQYLKHSYAS